MIVINDIDKHHKADFTGKIETTLGNLFGCPR